MIMQLVQRTGLNPKRLPVTEAIDLRAKIVPF